MLFIYCSRLTWTSDLNRFFRYAYGYFRMWLACTLYYQTTSSQILHVKVRPLAVKNQFFPNYFMKESQSVGLNRQSICWSGNLDVNFRTNQVETITCVPSSAGERKKRKKRMCNCKHHKCHPAVCSALMTHCFCCVPDNKKSYCHNLRPSFPDLRQLQAFGIFMLYPIWRTGIKFGRRKSQIS